MLVGFIYLPYSCLCAQVCEHAKRGHPLGHYEYAHLGAGNQRQILSGKAFLNLPCQFTSNT